MKDKIIEGLKFARLDEGRDAFIYHFTSVDGFSSIIRDGEIRGTKPGIYYSDDARGRVSMGKRVISVTRDRNYYFGSIRLTLDQRRISQKYKIVPYSEKGGKGEAEEVILTDKLPLLDYLIEIEIVKSPRDGSGMKYFDDSIKDTSYSLLSRVGRGTVDSGSNEQEVVGSIVRLVLSGKVKAGDNLKAYVNRFKGFENNIKFYWVERLLKN